jgi:hypothetical protein
MTGKGRIDRIVSHRTPRRALHGKKNILAPPPPPPLL